MRSASGGGAFAALKNIPSTLLAMAHTRLQLLGNEILTEKHRALRELTLVLAMVVCAGLGLLLVVGLDVITADDKTISGRDPELEVAPVAHHVEGAIADDRQQSNHAQHGGLAQKNVAANLLVIDDLAFFDPADRRVDVDCGLQTLDLGSLNVNVFDQF